MTATPTPPPVPSDAPAPTVPYGPQATGAGAAPATGRTFDLSRQSVAGTAGKWAIRILLPLVVRAIFRAIFR